eukprot:353707-Chlamydomonas_euryale.AAC.21
MRERTRLHEGCAGSRMLPPLEVHLNCRGSTQGSIGPVVIGSKHSHRNNSMRVAVMIVAVRRCVQDVHEASARNVGGGAHPEGAVDEQLQLQHMQQLMMWCRYACRWVLGKPRQHGTRSDGTGGVCPSERTACCEAQAWCEAHMV